MKTGDYKAVLEQQRETGWPSYVQLARIDRKLAEKMEQVKQNTSEEEIRRMKYFSIKSCMIL